MPKNVLEGFGAFHGWQTAGLNASKKLLMSTGKPRKALDVADETAKFHTSGGPRRRPGLSEGRGRRIYGCI